MSFLLRTKRTPREPPAPCLGWRNTPGDRQYPWVQQFSRVERSFALLLWLLDYYLCRLTMRSVSVNDNKMTKKQKMKTCTTKTPIYHTTTTKSWCTSSKPPKINLMISTSSCIQYLVFVFGYGVAWRFSCRTISTQETASEAVCCSFPSTLFGCSFGFCTLNVCCAAEGLWNQLTKWVCGKIQSEYCLLRPLL